MFPPSRKADVCRAWTILGRANQIYDRFKGDTSMAAGGLKSQRVNTTARTVAERVLAISRLLVSSVRVQQGILVGAAMSGQHRHRKDSKRIRFTKREGDPPSAQDRVVRLLDGREFDVGRSRWDGVLDREEYAYCAENRIPLAYDGTQIGWVTQASTDERASETPRPPTQSSPTIPTSPEGRANQLVRELQGESRQVVADVRAGAISLGAARDRLASLSADAVKRFADGQGLQVADRCHWSLQSSAAQELGRNEDVASTPAPTDPNSLSFRPWSPEDVGIYQKLLGNPKVWEYLPEPYPSPFTEDTARSLIEVSSFGFHHETVAVELDGQPVGQCLLRFDEPFAGARAAEVAYWLGEEHWGKGLMSRILPVFTLRSFHAHSVDVVYAWIRRDHVASARVAERAGYKRDTFPLESELAESLRRSDFIRYATYRVDWPVEEPAPQA